MQAKNETQSAVGPSRAGARSDKGARYTAWLVKYRLLVLLLTVALAAASAVGASKLEFDSTLEGWLLEDDPGLVAYRDFIDRFVGDEISVIGVTADDVFDPKVLATIDRVSKAARKAPHVHRVRSLTNVKIFDNDPDGGLEIERLIKTLPASAKAAAALRRQALDNPLLAGTLVAKDGKTTAIVVELVGGPDLMQRKMEQVRVLEQIVAGSGAPAGVGLHLGGTPVLDKAFYDYNKRDFRIILPVSSFVVLLIAWLIFRRPFFTVLPSMVVLLSLLIVFGLMGFLGLKVSILSTMVAALVLAVGVADAVHVLSDYRRNLEQGLDRAVALRRSVAHLFIPCLFTSITTAAGFLSLLTSDLSPVREGGWLSAVGVMIAFGLSMTLLPALLSFARRRPARREAGPLDRLVGAVASRMGGLSRPASVKVLVVSAALVLAVAARLIFGGMNVGANPIGYFRPGDPVRSATELIDERLGGSTSIELLVNAPEGGLKDPEILRRMDRVQRYVETLPGVSRALSVVDYIKELNRVVHDGDKRHAVVPGSRQAVAQYYMLLEGEEEYSSMVQQNESLGRITALVNFSGSDALAKRLPEVQARLKQEFAGTGATATITGFVKLMGDMEHYLVRSQIDSMLLAFAVITLMMFILLRSLRLGLLAMIPNLVPILLGLGFMTLIGVGLDPGTVMIGSIALGLVVDDTVHFMVQLKRRVRRGDTMSTAIDGTLHRAGRPIILTSVILIAGFLVATLGSFNPNVNFGFISAVVILLALLADLVILPAALKVLRPRLVGNHDAPARRKEGHGETPSKPDARPAAGRADLQRGLRPEEPAASA